MSPRKYDKKVKLPDHQLRPLQRYEAATQAIEEGKLELAQVAWSEFCYEVLGEYQTKQNKIENTPAKREVVAKRLGVTTSEASRMIEHVLAMKPPVGKHKAQAGPGHKKNDLGQWTVRKAERRQRVIRMVHPLRLFRLTHNMSIETMTQLAGMSCGTLDSWENGRRSPNVRSIYRVCQVINVNEDKLLVHWIRWMRMADAYLDGKSSALFEYMDWLNTEGASWV